MTKVSEVISENSALLDGMQKELELKSDKFDHHIEHDKDYEIARMLFIEIKELRFRIRELISQSETNSQNSLP